MSKRTLEILIIKDLGLDCRAGVVQVPVEADGEIAFKMSYQHDLIIEKDNEVKVIGSIKTSSKDRIDKIFIDKFLYNKLTEKATPHIAIFLNDVQRKNTKRAHATKFRDCSGVGFFRNRKRATAQTVKNNAYRLDLFPLQSLKA